MTTTAAPAGRSPGPKAWAALTLAETKMVVRDTAGLVIPLGLPLLILVMNGMGAGSDEVDGTSGMTVLDLYVMPLVLVMVVATIGVVNMPSFLSYYRKTGVLRRLAVTPANPAMVLVAQVLTSIAQTAIGVGLAVVVAMTVFDANLPRSPFVALGVFALTAAAMYAIGMTVAAIAPSGNASIAIGLVTFFAMGAVGGLFGPAGNLPDPLARVGEVLPFGAAVQALGDAWAGDTPEAGHLASLVTTVVVGALLSARFFRWD
ncbi:ABC transporter permease [Rhodococcus triatomae]|uniref:ABC-2 type transport system permease protein n=1 Tax=Rhodococcus triatomae TaxID=300028 RepID=A0A1G8GXY9_9NOCA|nr:ABC transporter permease [Rhodococcus triatomae]QNG20265.1 ABC transporter permease [Rhodococcus triatomae]QNG23820.1 ABC transporter permease [Rhodococcus triatomae]SDH99263.1 ABC-2 type transport system permease protein [Rhodococcus triatomae]